MAQISQPLLRLCPLSLSLFFSPEFNFPRLVNITQPIMTPACADLNHLYIQIQPFSPLFRSFSFFFYCLLTRYLTTNYHAGLVSALRVSGGVFAIGFYCILLPGISIRMDRLYDRVSARFNIDKLISPRQTISL